jgi:hypothetical protein
MSKLLNKFFITTALVVTPVVSQALPIDWHGVFGVDSTLISDYRRIKSETDRSSTNRGSQEVGLDVGDDASASWQSYIFRLSPTMVINDAATFKAELTTGYASGGYLGDSPQVNAENKNTVTLYHQNQAAGSQVNIKQAFIELYSDTATYVIGRHTYNWGLGAIYNDGSNTWDRHAYSRDGITMKLKIGNFHLSPFWSKISNPGYTRATGADELGIGLLYDNDERDIGFGIHYAVKSSNSNNTFYTSSIEEPTTPAEKKVGETNVKITDIYFRKTFGSLSFGIEVPLVSGDLGYTNNSGQITSISSKAFILQSSYKVKDEWNVGVDGGVVAGHDGSTGTFGALFLHPNYQVANLLFRYNIAALGDQTHNTSVYDSYITNAMYFKLKSSYSTEKWVFDTAIIYAIAQETAHAGKAAYNHSKNRIFTAVADQDDSLGTEFDLNATYKWNNEVSIGGGLGYLFTGDYFSYTNDPTIVNEAKNSLLLQINTSVTF